MSMPAFVLTGESQREFEKLLADITALYRPEGELQNELVYEIAAARWRLRRAAELEARLLSHEIERLQNEPENPLDADAALATAFLNLTDKSGPLTQLHRQEARLRRNYEKATKELKELQALAQEIAEIAEVETEQNEPARECSAATSARPEQHQRSHGKVEAFALPRRRHMDHPAGSIDAEEGRRAA